MDTDDPRSRLQVLPTFRQPDPPPPPPPGSSPTTTDPDPGLDPVLAGDGWLDEPPHPRRDRPATRTTTSSGGSAKPSVSDTAALVAGLLGLVVVGVAGLVKWRARRKLRRPTDGELDDIAAPLARIALRHADLSWLNADLADALKAGSAVGAYVNAGPLLEQDDPFAIPANLQEDQA